MQSIDLTHYFTILKVSGEKAAAFLQSQLTNDVAQASAKNLQWQAYCNRQGMVQSIFGLWCQEPHYYILIAKDLAPATAALLQKYGVFSKIQLETLTEVAISLALTQQLEKNLVWQIEHSSAQHLTFNWHSDFCSFAAQGAPDQGLWVLRALLIDHQFPWLDKVTSDCFRPHELNLPQLGIVNFQKGCFPGQEIIARMQYRGAPKQGLYIFCVAGDQHLVPGQLLMAEERQVGQIVDAVTLSNFTWVSAVLPHASPEINSWIRHEP